MRFDLRLTGRTVETVGTASALAYFVNIIYVFSCYPQQKQIKYSDYKIDIYKFFDREVQKKL